MNAASSSYEFHKSIESPMQFVRREWPALAVFGGGFAVMLLVSAFTVSSAYFYPRLRTDALQYYLKGLAFAQTGHTAARMTINTAPFPFVAMPGVLRSPFIFAFRDFDTQLRAIQIFNVALVVFTTTLYAYVLSWAVPRRWHWLAVAYAFAFCVLSPDWVANVFEVLADAPYALFSILCVILVSRILASPEPVRRQWVAIGAAILCFVIAFLTRFTAPVLLFYVAVLIAGRFHNSPLSRRATLGAATGAILLVTILVTLNWQTIITRYLHDPYTGLMLGSKPGIIVNLFAVAMPSQIIPDLRLALRDYSIPDPYQVIIGWTLRDLTVLTLGLCVSVVTLWGMWRSRNRFLPEIAYTLAPIPLLALIIPGTSRYLMAYQPFFWIFFYTGAATLAQPIAIRIARWPRAAFAGIALVVATGAGLVLLRAQKVRTSGNHAAISFGETRSHAPEIESTYQSLRAFLEKLPRQRALLIGVFGTEGRWKVVSGLDYYRADSALASVATTKDVYVVSECGTYEVCQNFERWDSTLIKKVDKFGPFRFDSVFSHVTTHARARVYRLRFPP